MRGKAGVINALVCGLSLMVAGCTKSEVKHYRLTAIVETPQGERQGHSVIETVFTGVSPLGHALFGSQASASLEWRGEAVAVDLPDGQTLFVLLRSAVDPEWAAWVRADISNGEVRAVPRRKDNSYGEMIDNYPLFVRFRDLRDPKSVEQVNPDDLATSFGAGYRLKALTFQNTDKAVTVGIEKRLGWLSTQSGSLVKYPFHTPISEIPIVHRIHEGDFTRGHDQ